MTIPVVVSLVIHCSDRTARGVYRGVYFVETPMPLNPLGVVAIQPHTKANELG